MYLIALDQGTTSSRCVVFDKNGKIVSLAQKEFKQIYPNPGWVEHNPIDLWSTQVGVTTEALAQKGISAKEVFSIGITNQRETTIVWNKHTGVPIYNAIVWQCRRTANFCQKLKEQGFEAVIKAKTGLVLDPYFSASKIKWILDNVENARELANNGDLLFGTVDTWLLWKLTNKEVHATDYTNASRTMLFNIHTLTWDEELLALFDIPKSMLPEIKPTVAPYGYSSREIFGEKIAITAIAGDQHAALFGQTCFEKGSIKCTYGTGLFLLMNTNEEIVSSDNGLLTTIAWAIDDKVEYAIEGSVFVAGAAIKWLRDEMQLIKDAKDTEKIAKSIEDTNGVYVVPSFTGLAAPYWDSYARGIIIGITRGVNKDHIIRATLEAIAYQAYDIIKLMEQESLIQLSSLFVDGGASTNDFLMQFQADLLNTEVTRKESIEITALGVALLSGLGSKVYKDKEEIKTLIQNETKFIPKKINRDKLIKGWHKAVKRSLAWIEDEE